MYDFSDGLSVSAEVSSVFCFPLVVMFVRAHVGPGSPGLLLFGFV